MIKLSEEQKELLKNEENADLKYTLKMWETIVLKGHSDVFWTKNTVHLFLKRIIKAKDLEAEQKVEQAVRNERERCADIVQNGAPTIAFAETSEYMKGGRAFLKMAYAKILEPPKE